MRKLRKFIIWVVVIKLAVFIAAKIAQRLLPRSGDETSDEFERSLIISGEALTMRSDAFVRGSLLVVMGGAQIDLRHARLHPDGAVITARTIFGGLQVLVPPEWRVDVVGEAKFGEHDADVTDPADLPEDAPHLVVELSSQFSGAQIVARPIED